MSFRATYIFLGVMGKIPLAFCMFLDIDSPLSFHLYFSCSKIYILSQGELFIFTSCQITVFYNNIVSSHLTEAFMKSITETVTSLFSDMSKSEQAVASYFLDHVQDFTLNTLDSVADSIGVSTTSVIRFCRRVGFAGYKDFQNHLRT